MTPPDAPRLVCRGFGFLVSWGLGGFGARGERRVSVCEDAPGFRLGPRVVTRTQARGDGL